MPLLRTVTTRPPSCTRSTTTASSNRTPSTQRLSIKDNLRVVLTFNPGERTVTQLPHNKPNADELMANLALAEMNLIHFPLPILQKLCNTLLTKREDVIRRFKTMSAITWLTIEVLPTPTRSDLPRRSPFHPSSSTRSPT